MSCEQDPQPGQRWRASYEGLVVPRSEHPSEGTWFSLRGDGERVVAEFYHGDTGWVYEKLAGTREELLLALLEELAGDTRCLYDHDAFCLTHYREHPCANARALEIVMAARVAKTEDRNDG